MRARTALLTASLLLTAMITPAGAAAAADTGTLLGTVPVRAGQRISAAIFDAKGNRVRHLADMSAHAGDFQVRWDGKDDNGDDLPASPQYSWRAAVTSATGEYQGQVGDPGGQVGNKPSDDTETPSETDAVAYDAGGNLYTDSQSEEWDPLRKYPPGSIATGERSWYRTDGAVHRGYALAADDDYVYTAGRQHTDDKQMLIHRTRTHPVPDPTDPQHQRMIPEGGDAPFDTMPYIPVDTTWKFGDLAVTGMAVDQHYLLVSYHNALLAYDKKTGAPANVLNGQPSLPLTDPRGITTDGAGTWWLAVGNEIDQYTMDGAGHFTAGQRIVGGGLVAPSGVTWDHGHNRLYVSDGKAGKIHLYDVSGAAKEVPSPLAAIGPMAGPGPIDDQHVGWPLDATSGVPHGAAIAVSPDGRTLAATDFWNQRTLFFDTTTGVASADRFSGVRLPSPDVDQGTLSSSGFEYTVDYPGRTWRLVANWNPTDNADSFAANNSIIRTVGGQRYLYVFVLPQQSGFPGGGVVVYRLGAQRGLTRVAQLTVTVVDGSHAMTDQDAVHLRLTTNPNGIGQPGDQLTQTNLANVVMGNPSAWVDSAGTLWFAEAAQYKDGKTTIGTGELPIGTGGAMYDLSRFAIAPGSSHEFDPQTTAEYPIGEQVRYDTKNGRIYAEADAGMFDQGGNYAGNAVSVVDTKKGGQVVLDPRLPSDGLQYPYQHTVLGLAVDSDGGNFYTAGFSNSGTEITMYTSDGLPLARAAARPPLQLTGLIDMGTSVTEYTTGGVHYVYTQDDGNASNQRFAFSNVTVQRYGSDPDAAEPNRAGDFSWPGVPTSNGLTAWWKLNAMRKNYRYVADSAGQHWGIGGATNLIDFLAPTQSGQHSGGLTFDGTQYVQFTKSYSGIQPDNLFAQGNDSLSLWFSTQQAGVLVGTRDDTATGVPMLYVDSDHKLHSAATSCGDLVSTSKILDGLWHHATLTRTAAHSVLYLDGVQQAESNGAGCGPRAAGRTVLGDGYVNGVEQHLTGALDDVRIYGKELTADDVRTLAQPRPLAGPFAHWTMTAGPTIPDLAGGDDLSTATSALTGDQQGLHFTGKATESAPLIADHSVTTHGTETITVRVRIPVGSTGGPVLGEQVGRYPTALSNPYGGASPPSVAAISITPNGQVQTYVMGNPLTSPCTIADSQWHTIVVAASAAGSTGDVSSNTLYVSGCKDVVGRVTNQGEVAAAHIDMQFGAARVDPTPAAPSTTWQIFSGDIGEALVYQRDLTDAELQNLGVPTPPVS